MGLDIGPHGRPYAAAIAAPGRCFWNGPMGAFELEPFAAGTRASPRPCAGAGHDGGRRRRLGRGAAEFGLADEVDWLSTGGGRR
jgi:phosphoglycerate kinase